MFGSFVLYIFLLQFIQELIAQAANNGSVWNYNDEGNWPGNRCKEGGRRQSPIDIRTTNMVTDFTNQFIKYGTLKFVGYKRVLVAGINNGHTIQFSTEGEESIHPVLTGGPLEHQYRLQQIQFHWLSEHSISGMKYPMEIHFVHVRSDLSMSAALQKRDGFAILAVFCQVQAELDDYQLESTEEFMQHIPRLQQTGDRISGVLLDMTRHCQPSCKLLDNWIRRSKGKSFYEHGYSDPIKKLLSPNKYNYYTYAGSLTSPECNEVVIWIIFDSPIYLSEAQYGLFNKVGVGHYNFRSLQKLNRHVVFSPPASHINTPQIVLFFESVARLFTGLLRNVTTFMANGFKAR